MLELQSEDFRATGGVTAQGARRTLGRPAFERLDVLVREAVQNCWDARVSKVKPVRVSISSHALTEAQQKTLSGQIFADLPPKGLPLARCLNRDVSLRVLTINDRGTTGLGGPTRADQDGEGEEARDFVDFIRNIGQPRDKEMGGGTYGYGKASFYVFSEASTICVYTRCRSGNKNESRLIGVGWGHSYKAGGRLFTGRHWWGRRGKDNIVDPVTGDEADQLARDSGFEPFGSSQRGTSIMVLAPALDEGRDLRDSMNRVVENLLWYFWPKMIESESGFPPMEFNVNLDNEELEVPNPENYPPLSVFVEAYRRMKSTPEDVEEDNSLCNLSNIECLRPKQLVGRVCMTKAATRKRGVLNGRVRQIDIAEPQAHHIALMRNAELVVCYLAGPGLPVGAMEYGGVFIPHADIDSAFADAEPPTHDDWKPEMLEDPKHRTFVRTALRKCREEMVEFTEAPSVSDGESSQVPLGTVAEHLGGLFAGEEGPGARVQEEDPEESGESRERGRRGRRARVSILNDGQHCVVDGKPAYKLQFQVVPADDSSGTRVVAEPKVLVLGGGALENEPPAGAELPRVLKWESSAGTVVGRDSMQIHAGLTEPITVFVSVPENCMIQVGLRAEGAQP